MPTTPDLNITHVDPAQSNKTATINEAFDLLDQAITDMLTVVCTAGGTITPTSASAFACMVLKLTGTPGAGFNLVVPTTKKLYIVNNASGKTATVKTSGGSGVAVLTGTVQIVYADGTNVIAITAGVSSGTIDYANITNAAADVAVDFGVGVLSNSQTIGFRATRVHNFTANFGSSKGDATAASASSAVITVKKNGSAIGTITYSTSTSATFATSGGAAQSLAAGDLLEFVGPSSADSTLAGVRITLLGTRP